MADLYDLLKERLSNTSKLAILGAGSFQKGDDASGVMITEKLKERFGNDKFDKLCIYTGECAPENYTGEIKKFNPSHVIMIDAANIREEPGSVAFIEPDAIGGVSFSTHILPLKIIIEYLIMETGCHMTVIGIQPLNIEYGGEVTLAVLEAVEDTVEVIERLIKEFNLV
ncbi:MAG TPA: hydrogenase 3 maturation endopeptidase HyCI [Clostridia bacterium]|nr:hydrogenase 3 maturation endopeptidase HyCI [Clostridia bacterium]